MKQAQGTAIGAVVIFAVVCLAALIIGLAGFDQVSANNIGVMDRFGVIQGSMNPGLRWTGLFVHVTSYPISIQKIELQKVRAVDKTGQDVFADVVVTYRLQSIETPQRLYKEVGPVADMRWVEAQLAVPEKIQEALKQVTVKYEALEILEKRDEVRLNAEKRIEDLFPKEYFQIVSITVTNIDFQPSFNAAIQLKKDNTQLAQAAQEAVKKSQYEADQAIQVARGASESMMKKADGDAYTVSVMADADAHKKKVTGEAEAYALKLKKQELTALMVNNNWIDRWNGQLPTYVMGDSSNVMMVLPTGATI